MRPLPILAGLAALAVLIASAWAVTVRTDAGQDTAEAASGLVVRARPPVVVVEDLPQLKASLDVLADRGRFTGAVLVARGDQVLFRQVYGMADREAGRPFDLDTPLRLASVSKMFTAAAILRLQDEGVLSVEDTVCDWIADCPEAWVNIRIGHLISHQSGIPDLMARPGWGTRRVTPATLEELTRDSALYNLQFEPGTDLRYNNAGFNLAAAVVEAATGVSFQRYLEQTFFEPLGMSQTGFDAVPGLAMGYAHFPAGITPQPDANVSIIPGAGALSSTVDDLLAWTWALHRGGLLSSEAHAAMIADHAPSDTPGGAAPPLGLWPVQPLAGASGRACVRGPPDLSHRQLVGVPQHGGLAARRRDRGDRPVEQLSPPRRSVPDQPAGCRRGAGTAFPAAHGPAQLIR